ncbi:MAG TPA: hypothetical protein VIO38_06375 [Rariglobus sp.]
MNPHNIQLFATLSVVTGCLVTIFWMVVGWRAMRAHEKIAAALSEEVEQKSHWLRSALKQDRNKDEKTFRDFLDADPVARQLDPTEQVRRFAEWKHRQE